MGRYSPSVLPSAEPGALTSLAQALMQGYQGARDRNRQRQVQDAELAGKGVTIEDDSFGSRLTGALQRKLAGPQVPEMTPPPTNRPSVDSAAQPEQAVDTPFGPSAAPLPSPSGVPGAWNPLTSQFEKVSQVPGLPVQTLPSGVTVDPNVPIQRKVAEERAMTPVLAERARATGEVGLDLGTQGRALERGERERALASVGAPTAAGVQAGSTTPWLTPDDRDWQYRAATYDEPAQWVNVRTRTREAVEGSKPLTRPASGTQLAHNEKIKSIDDILDITRRARAPLAEGQASGERVSGRLGRVIPIPNSWRLEFDVGGKPGRQLTMLIGDLTSRVGNLRSGGAITPQEFERLESFLPTMNDKPDVIEWKLNEFETTLKNAKERRGREASAPAAPDAAGDLVSEFERMFGRTP